MRKKSRKAEIKKLLKQVVKVLNEDTKESAMLWDILSALRGPDILYPPVLVRELKELTTARIRAAIGLRDNTTACFMVSLDPLSPENRSSRDSILKELTSLTHFRWHYQEAVKAIRELFKYDLIEEKKL